MAEGVFTLSAGSTIREYTLVSLLGEGPFSQVWEAHHQEEGEASPYAIKVATHPMYARWLAEHETFALDVDHPNLLLASEIDFAHNPPYLVCERVEGESLRQRLESGRRVAPAEAMAVMRQTAAGVAALHAVLQFHGCLMPKNILLAADGRALVLDTETARITRDIALISTRTRKNEPTPPRIAALLPYVAPEDLAFPGRTELRCDVFSLGIIFFQLLTRKPPPTRPLGPADLKDLPPPAKALILDCLAKEEARPASAGVVVERLREIGSQLSAWARQAPAEAAPEEDFEYEVDEDGDFEYEVDDEP